MSGSYLPEDLKKEIAHVDHKNKLQLVHNELIDMTKRVFDRLGFLDMELYSYSVYVVDFKIRKEPPLVRWTICCLPKQFPEVYVSPDRITYFVNSIREAKKITDSLKRKRVRSYRGAIKIIDELSKKKKIAKKPPKKENAKRVQPPRKCKQ
jgi:hypothetical protein